MDMEDLNEADNGSEDFGAFDDKPVSIRDSLKAAIDTVEGNGPDDLTAQPRDGENGRFVAKGQEQPAAAAKAGQAPAANAARQTPEMQGREQPAAIGSRVPPGWSDHGAYIVLLRRGDRYLLSLGVALTRRLLARYAGIAKHDADSPGRHGRRCDLQRHHRGGCELPSSRADHQSLFRPRWRRAPQHTGHRRHLRQCDHISRHGRGCDAMGTLVRPAASIGENTPASMVHPQPVMIDRIVAGIAQSEKTKFVT
ncbi:hypothetical protein Rleg4DRAFT_1584 [Rhizobium leguminosarum bv. trifolii WSM2297]|uniref:Uncharacterized protein n=1 Tax=Rhizobium leguminosarum bv. trifolii WSM2297 TaxID=754762 RepID=J0W484_RHILT|nr:hypothetical protein Rleg4DRAFT_1584 [Rhizobium leguminosarum bv. trifolii WSM2297]